MPHAGSPVIFFDDVTLGVVTGVAVGESGELMIRETELLGVTKQVYGEIWGVVYIFWLSFP